MADPIGILKFEPVLKRIRWGGRRLGSVLNKPLGDADDYAESWEVSCHANGPSVIANGPHKGTALAELIAKYPDELLGPKRKTDAFPLLIKFLDAADRLSVQVHPDDAQAQAFEPGANGKTEAWVILDAAPDSRLYVGLKADVDAETLRRAIDDGNIEACLHSFPVKAGDCVFIPAGTVHAIGEGILLAEVQQSSDITFRLHDWGRVGTDGKPRELHIDEALSCIDFNRGPVNPVTPEVLSENVPRSELLVEADYFTMRRHTATETFELPPAESFRVLMTLAGSAAVTANDDRANVLTGETILIPACCHEAAVTPGNDGVTMLEAIVPAS